MKILKLLLWQRHNCIPVVRMWNLASFRASSQCMWALGTVSPILIILFYRNAVETDQRVRMARCCEDVCAHLVDLFLGEEIFQTAKETLQELQCFCKYLQR